MHTAFPVSSPTNSHKKRQCRKVVKMVNRQKEQQKTILAQLVECPTQEAFQSFPLVMN